jgi:protease I
LSVIAKKILMLAGGTYKEVAVNEAVTDGNLTTSPAWPGHPAILKAFYRLLGINIKTASAVVA